MAKRPNVKFGICLYRGVWAASANLARDVLHIASGIARARGAADVDVRFLAERSGRVVTPTGVTLTAEASWSRVDVIILPSRAMPFLDAPIPRGLTDWLVERHRGGATVLSMATGSWLLADSGLLKQRRATTHWACVERSRTRFPDVQWTSDERLTISDRVITARDASAASLALCHLVGRTFGPAIGERTSQYALVFEPGAEALPLLHTVPLRQHRDSEVLQAQDWLEAHFAEPFTTERLGRHVHMSARNLRRRFLAATGHTIVAYLSEVRLARARALLESTNAPVSEVAMRVGYEDAATFSALFKSRHRISPSEYRAQSVR